jgi:hypothetical protein
MDDLILQGGIIAGPSRICHSAWTHPADRATDLTAQTTLDISAKLVLPGFIESYPSG